MFVTLTSDDFIKLSPKARAEVLALLQSTSMQTGEIADGFTLDDFDGVVDLTPGQIEEFMKGCAPETVKGLEVFAKQGPAVAVGQLSKAGIPNYSHFQGRVTKRARTVTGQKDAHLFAWDDWSAKPDGEGRYAVTNETWRSLRVYFNLV